MKTVANVVYNDFTNDSRVLKISQSLMTLGFQPIVVAVHNNGLKERESVGGVDVERLKLIVRHWSARKPVQLLKYLHFLLLSSWRFRGVDIVHCNDITALPVGVLIKIFGRKAAIVYDCHEYQTEINGLSGAKQKVMKLLETWLIRFADQVCTVSDSIADDYARLYRIPKPKLVLNCPFYQEQPPKNLFREGLGIRANQNIFLYQGGFAKGRGIELLLEAFCGLENDDNVIVFMGSGLLEPLVREKADKNKAVFFYPAVSPDVLLNYTASADFGISFAEDSCLNHRYCLPNKLFEYLMAGLPVITSNLVEMKSLVDSEGVGVVASTNTVEGFKAAVKETLDRDLSGMKENAVEARKKYCWEEQEGVLKEVYNSFLYKC